MPDPKRPFSVTCLTALVLTFTAAQILRVWAALSNFALYSQLPLRVPTIYFVVSGLIWTAVSLALIPALWRGKAWAPRGLRWGLAAWLAFSWLDRLVLQAPGPQSINWPFELGVTLLLLITIFGVLALPKAQAYYGVDNGRSLKD